MYENFNMRSRGVLIFFVVIGVLYAIYLVFGMFFTSDKLSLKEDCESAAIIYTDKISLSQNINDVKEAENKMLSTCKAAAK